MLILKANMKVIVLKSVWGPGTCPRGHVSMQKKSFKIGRFFGSSEFNNAKSETTKVKYYLKFRT